MTPDEIVILARYVRALCPQQRFDEYTPDAWGDVLSGYQLDDARTAAARIARRQPFVAPAEIAHEIAVIRGERLAGFRYEPQPGDDDPAVYLAAYRQQRTAVADGRRAPAIERAITGPTIPQLLDDQLDDGQTIGQLPAAPDKPSRRGPLGVHCPKCSARIGRACRTPGGSDRRPHSARRRAAAGQTTPEPQTDAQRLSAARQALAALTPAQRAQLTQETAQ